MENVFVTCDRCEKEINYGITYFSIVRNIEYAEHVIATGKDEVETIDSQQLITLCNKCGSRFSFDAISNIINALPLDTDNTNPN